MSAETTTLSLAESLRSLPATKRTKILARLSPQELKRIEFCWPVWARPKQLAPKWSWRTWLISAGRGFGKTRTGAEWVRGKVESGQAKRIALVARTAGDVRDVIVEGESGILAISPPWCRPEYQPSKRRLLWPNGAIATTYSADEPNSLRGPQHDAAWCDELAAWQYPDAWDQLQFGLRLGTNPQCVVTTTPRPTPIIRSLVADTTTAVTTGSTYENKANLAKAFVEQIVKKYEGTRLGRQELYAEILDDAPGALWKRGQLEDDRRKLEDVPDLVRVVIAIDPSVSADSDEAATGIVAVGLGADGHGYLLEDGSLVKPTPEQWARKAIELYERHEADRIIGEVNNGGDLVESNIRAIDRDVSYRSVRASRGKEVRAEPIAALDEQHRIHHVGLWPELEDELCTWEPGVSKNSPNRLDAYVWGFTELMLGGQVIKNAYSAARARRGVMPRARD